MSKQFSDLGFQHLSQSANRLKISANRNSAKAIPLLLENKTDLVGLAKGTGKTAAFGLPLLQLIDTKHTNVQAVILVPTRD
jgi:ATP-dependent RNA helicase DeaD